MNITFFIRNILFLLLMFCYTAFSQMSKKVTIPPQESIPLQKSLIDKEVYQQVLKILEQKSVMDQVIADDLIVQGSGCFGFDCVNNESFGFDTIRMKENNTRIAFDDTSVGSFPSNDWQIEANPSASGATSSFSIIDVTGSKTPFKIEAGAKTNALYVSSSGRIGLGTSTPVLDAHIANSNTPAVRLEQNSSGGFTAQTWDMAGNEANFFIRDATGGSSLPFRIRPGAPTSSIDISSNAVYVKNAILPASAIPSDIRFKKDIEKLKDATNIILNLSPKTYQYDTEKFADLGFSKNLQYGLIAQEVEKTLPELVEEKPFPNGKNFMTVNYTGLIPILIKGMQEQQSEIEGLKAKINEYESINTRLLKLEAMLITEEKPKKNEKNVTKK